MSNTSQVCALLAILVVPATAQTADMFWSNGRGDGSGTFSNATNWSPGVPGPNDNAHFGMTTSSTTLPHAYTVAFTNDPTTNSLHIEDDLVTFDLNGRTYSTMQGPGNTIGTVPGRTGSLTVTDGLLDIQSVLFVGGGGGTGRLTITQGGRVQSDFFARIANFGSNGTVNVSAGSQWIHDGELSIGWGGAGTMNVTSGALVQNGTGMIADGTGPGTVTVSGANSLWTNNGTLIVGDSGTGTLNITAGGRVNAAGAVIGNEPGSVGEVNIDGPTSMLSSSAPIFVSSFGPGTGTLTVTNGGTVATQGGLFVRTLGTLRGGGQIVGNLNNTGVVAPGTSPGALQVTGNFAQAAAGKLQIDLAGTTPGSQFDTLSITGSATLAGTLEVSLINGFSPTSGDVFEVLHANGGILGGFGTLLLPPTPTGTGWAIVYTGTSVLLHLQSATLAGDLNGDGAVDAADYVLWRKTGGTPEAYDQWRANFSASLGNGSLQVAALPQSSAIPEPTSALLFLSFTAIGVRRHRRGFHRPQFTTAIQAVNLRKFSDP